MAASRSLSHCSVLDIHRNFGEINCLQFQGRKVSEKQRIKHCYFLYFDPENGAIMFLRNVFKTRKSQARSHMEALIP
jgi:hypothetical protein